MISGPAVSCPCWGGKNIFLKYGARSPVCCEVSSSATVIIKGQGQLSQGHQRLNDFNMTGCYVRLCGNMCHRGQQRTYLQQKHRPRNDPQFPDPWSYESRTQAWFHVPEETTARSLLIWEAYSAIQGIGVFWAWASADVHMWVHSPMVSRICVNIHNCYYHWGPFLSPRFVSS